MPLARTLQTTEVSVIGRQQNTTCPVTAVRGGTLGHHGQVVRSAACSRLSATDSSGSLIREVGGSPGEGDRLRQGGRTPRTWELVVITLGTFALVAMAFAPLGEFRVGDRSTTLSLVDLRSIGYAATVLVVILGVVAVIDGYVRHRPSTVAGVGYAVLAVCSAVVILLTEGSNLLIPRSLLPTTIRRFTVALGSGYAPWIAMLLLVLMAFAAVGSLGLLFERLDWRTSGETGGQYALRAMMGVGMLGGALLVAFGRQRPLATVNTPIDNVDVEIWALPFAGPASLVLLIVLIGCSILALLRVRPVIAALVGGAAAWFIGVGSALALATSGLAAKQAILDWVADVTNNDTIAASASIAVGPSAALGLWGASIAGGSLAATLTLKDRNR